MLYYLANRAIYHPFAYPKGLWQLQGPLGAQDVSLRAADGVELHAWWVPRPGAKAATLFLHGNAGNLTHRAHKIIEITAAGSSMLLLDYRGYGKSRGQPTEKGLFADADAAYQYLRAAGHRPERIVVYGESLGTAVAVDLAARQPCGGLVLEACFTSASDVAGRLLPLVGPLVVRSFDSRGKIARVRAPVLVMHGDRDGVIPFDLGRALFDAAAEPKSFWTVAGAGHNDVVEVAGSEYRRRLAEFFRLVEASS